MGEMADFTLDYSMFPDDNYWHGEDYDDAMEGPDCSRRLTPMKVCKYCGTTSLHWENIDNRWRLFDIEGKMHQCPVNPIKVKSHG